MIEVFQIILFFHIFVLLLFLPLNIFSKSNFLNQNSFLDIISLNLGVNLNVLLLLSFLPISVQVIQPYIIIIYLLYFLYIYQRNLLSILKYLKSFWPLLFIFFLFSVNMTFEIYLGWDAKYFYYIKSLFFFEEKTIFDLNQFDHSNWHPHFGSYLWGFFWSLSFIENEYFGRIFYLFLFCFSFFIISKISKKDEINNIIFLMLVFIFYEYEFFSGLQEILIFSILVIISKYFFLISSNINKNNLFSVLLIILFSNILIWIKSEGIVYFFIIFSLLIIQNQLSIKKRLCISVLLILLYLSKVFIDDISELENGQNVFYNFDYLLELNLQIIFNKLVNIVVWFFYYLFNNFFFAIFVLLLLYQKFFANEFFKKYKKYYLILKFYLFSIIMFIIFAYVLRDMDIIYALRTTMDRMLMTASGFFIYPCLIFFKYYSKIKY